MLIKSLEPITLLTIKTRQKQANGTYVDIYEEVDTYNVSKRELTDQVDADIYGASISNMLHIASPLKDLEKLLYSKVNNKEDNISKYKFNLDGIDYKIKAVKMSGIDIERY